MKHLMWFKRDGRDRVWVVCTCGWKAHHKRPKIQEQKATKHQEKYDAEWASEVAGL